MLLGSGGSAEAINTGKASGQGIKKYEENVAAQHFRVEANPRLKNLAYEWDKPEGFKRLTNVGNPGSYVFRNVGEKDFAISVVVEKDAGADMVFTPKNFVDDYKSKFTNATGSSVKFIREGLEPVRIDSETNTKYYQVEYVVRTQLGFTFDTLRSLHFITVFGAGKDCMYVFNAQAPDEYWSGVNSTTLEAAANSFKVMAK